jgi:MbtH protein
MSQSVERLLWFWEWSGMASSDEYTIDGQRFQVLINDEGQYSIWPAKKPVPEGWKSVAFAGSKAECTEFIDRSWTDMRPISLQNKSNAGPFALTEPDTAT